MIRLKTLLTEEPKQKDDTAVQQTVKKDAPYVSGDTYVSREEAKRFYDYLNYNFDFEQFYMGINVELEHQDVTEGSLVKTAMIAAAHLKEVPNYYTLLKKYVEKKQ